MKRLFVLLLALVMLLSCAACAANQPAADQQAEEQTAENETTVEEPAVEEPAIEEPAVEEPAIEEPAVEEPVVEEPVETETETEAEVETEDNGNDILILYFSANNFTDTDAVSAATPIIDDASSVEWIANIIHDNVGGDIVPIIPSIDYPIDYNDVAEYAKQEADSEARPAYEDLGVDPTSYKTVFIGYPIWWYRMPMVLETLFDEYDFSGVTIVPFNTHEGSRVGGTYDMIRDREPNAVVLEGLPIRGGDTGKSDAESEVIDWLNGLELN